VTAVRVVLPGHLRRLAHVDGEVHLEAAVPTIASVLDALEASYPALKGTIRDQATGKRRNFVRYFACNEDLSHNPVDQPLPEQVTNGTEPFLVVAAMAGG
jgi:molybdopterin converting factor small subunit